MIMCKKHWGELETEIDKVGLKAWCVDNGNDATIKLQRQLEEGINLDTFDPLLNAYQAVTSNCLTTLAQAGILLEQSDCGLCVLIMLDPRFLAWIPAAATEMAGVFKELTDNA